jgi:Holliday junction resolvase-like predicted endonuclease
MVGYFLADGNFTVTINKSKNTIDAVFKISSKKVTGKNAFQVKIRNTESLKKALEFFSNNQPKSSDRNKRFTLMCHIFESKQNRTFKFDIASKKIRNLRSGN